MNYYYEIKNELINNEVYRRDNKIMLEYSSDDRIFEMSYIFE